GWWCSPDCSSQPSRRDTCMSDVQTQNRIEEDDRMVKTRVAKCACGGVSATAEGEPAMVSMCNCMECQRRTGSPFGVGVYFPKDAVKMKRSYVKSRTR